MMVIVKFNPIIKVWRGATGPKINAQATPKVIWLKAIKAFAQ